jgi:hypothetical protein
MPWHRSNYLHPIQEDILVANGTHIWELLTLEKRPLHDYQQCCRDKVWSSSRLKRGAEGERKPLLAFRAALSFTYALGAGDICQLDYRVVGKR